MHYSSLYPKIWQRFTVNIEYCTLLETFLMNVQNKTQQTQKSFALLNKLSLTNRTVVAWYVSGTTCKKGTGWKAHNQSGFSHTCLFTDFLDAACPQHVFTVNGGNEKWWHLLTDIGNAGNSQVHRHIQTLFFLHMMQSTCQRICEISQQWNA